MDQEKLKKFAPWAVVVGLLLLNGRQQNAVATPGVPGASISGVAVPVVASGPSAEMRGIVAPIAAVRLRNVEAAVKVSPFYRAAADVVRRDDGKIKTTGQFRTSRMAADALYLAKTPLVGTLGLGPSSDKAIADAIGLEDVALDAAKRARLAEVLDAIAWALEGGA